MNNVCKVFKPPIVLMDVRLLPPQLACTSCLPRHRDDGNSRASERCRDSRSNIAEADAPRASQVDPARGDQGRDVWSGQYLLKPVGTVISSGGSGTAIRSVAAAFARRRGLDVTAAGRGER